MIAPRVAHEAIVREVTSEPDLLVTESHRRGWLARWLLSNIDWGSCVRVLVPWGSYVRVAA